MLFLFVDGVVEVLPHGGEVARPGFHTDGATEGANPIALNINK
jgi:hypothetical protein